MFTFPYILGPREQMNRLTGFIDGSNVYGSDLKEQFSLRKFQHGKTPFPSISSEGLTTIMKVIQISTYFNNFLITKIFAIFF